MKFTKRRVLTEQLEKLGCKVYKEGVGLFVWAKLEGSVSAEKFIDQITGEVHFIALELSLK
jgi:DNA-binding transcriptional MocR family regulator